MDRKLDGKVILVCGPPASGKDTLTARLSKIDNRFWHFQKHRGIDGVIPNNQASSQYINIPRSKFEEMIMRNEFIQYHQRYDRYYGISQKVLKDNINNGKIPIIHVGRIENLYELENKIEDKVIKIFVWAPLNILEQRLNKRHPGNQAELERRLQAASEEFKDLVPVHLKKTFDIIFKNEQTLESAEKNLIALLKQQHTTDEEVKELERYINKYY
ncbi:hypothetical protein V7112_11680 [Bacillus sp. JJ1566]|uniref:hypothetical protein n=1 Tax=Bacillus sp. JJ1566 TaxID=3122961 RepID=UPI0030008B2E